VKLSFEDKLRRARTVLAVTQPFLAHLSFHTQTYESEAAPTAWTDGRDVWFNPHFARQLSPVQFTFVYAHELLHKAFLHVLRLTDRHPKLWNVATDLAINLILVTEAERLGGSYRQAPFEMPPGALLDKDLAGLSAEQIYEKLLEKAGGRGDDDTLSRLLGRTPSSDPLGSDLRPGKPLSEAEKAEIRQQVAAAAQAAKRQGKLPEGLERLVDALLYPTRDWRNELLAFVQQFPVDYSYLPPDRRFTEAEFFFPALQGERVDLWVALDTSGSIGKAELTRFVSEVKGILDGFDYVSCKLITCDAAVHEVVPLDSYEGIDALMQRVRFKGGGGTAFHPVWALPEEPPAACVYFTDGYGDFGAAPSFPVLWAVIEGGLELERFPYGRAVRVAREHL
jgi:predicted metal-dependent peptidase